MHLTALQVQQFCDLLELSEEISEIVWLVMKYVFSSEPTLLIQRHVDQLLMSSIYGVCKATDKQMKFQDIIEK